jgi:hypothetical protein
MKTIPPLTVLPAAARSPIMKTCALFLLLGSFQYCLGQTDTNLIATGDWSEIVSDGPGYALRGRLIVYDAEGKNQWGIWGCARVYVELQHVLDGVYGFPIEFDYDNMKCLRFELRDSSDRPIPQEAVARALPPPPSFKGILPCDSTLRFLACEGAGFNAKPDGLWILVSGGDWLIRPNATNSYFLSASFSPSTNLAASKNNHLWRGTLKLPKVQIPRTAATFEQPEPGPEAGGLRLRLQVIPSPESGNEGYDVQVDLISVSQKPIPLRMDSWPPLHEGSFKDYLEAAVSIESNPAIEPWLGQVGAAPEGTTPAEYTLKPGETLSLKWHTTGRHLKNNVSNPLKVQNPEFAENGLYSVHASLVIGVARRTVLLRSNEQPVPIGGSREMPKFTYGPLWDTDEKTRTAMLGLGSLQKIVPGDRFLIHTGYIGWTWKLRITKVEADHSFGTLEPSILNSTNVFPARGSNAALIRKK